MEYQFSDRLKNLKGNAIREIFKLLSTPGIISFAGGFPAKETLPVDEIREIADKVCRKTARKFCNTAARKGIVRLSCRLGNTSVATALPPRPNRRLSCRADNRASTLRSRRLSTKATGYLSKIRLILQRCISLKRTRARQSAWTATTTG